jgi:hypothetical protein
VQPEITLEEHDDHMNTPNYGHPNFQPSDQVKYVIIQQQTSTERHKFEADNSN